MRWTWYPQDYAYNRNFISLRDTNREENVNEWYAPSLCSDPIRSIPPKSPYTPKKAHRTGRQCLTEIKRSLFIGFGPLEVAADFVMLIQNC